jgi:hypothetical protein
LGGNIHQLKKQKTGAAAMAAPIFSLGLRDQNPMLVMSADVVNS